MALLRHINTYLTEYNFFIACCSLAFLAYFSLLMKVPFPAAIYIFTFCSTLSTYNLFRGYKSLAEFWNGPKNVQFFLILLGIAGCAASFFLLQFKMQVFYIVLGFLTMLYKFDLPGFKNLRSIPYLKLAVITIVWLLSGSIFLLLNIHADSDLGRIAGLLVMQFCFITAVAIPFDVYGLIEDEMPTIPGKVGIRKALWISKVLLFAYLAAAFAIHQRPLFLYAAAIVAAITFTVIHFSPLLKRKSVQYYLLDGPIILQTLIFYWLLF